MKNISRSTTWLLTIICVVLIALLLPIFWLSKDLNVSPSRKTIKIPDQDNIASHPQDKELASRQLNKLMGSLEETDAITLDDNSSSQILLIGHGANNDAASKQEVEQLIEDTTDHINSSGADFDKVAAQGLNKMIDQNKDKAAAAAAETSPSSAAKDAKLAAAPSSIAAPSVKPDDHAQAGRCYRVQLGTFAQTNNAYALEKKLSQSGYLTLIRYHEQYAKVLVGELASREAALQLKKQLAKRFNLQGIVVLDNLES